MTNVLNLKAWKKHLEKDSNGNFSRNLVNAICTIKNANEFKGRLGYDLFAHKLMVLGSLPWDEREDPRSIEDKDPIKLMEWMQLEGLHIHSINVVTNAIHAVCTDNGYHPVQDYLNGLEWDGIERLDEWLVRYQGAEGTAYTRAVARMFLISAVARIMQPGCQADHMLVLEGDQGIGKSQTLQALAEPWVLESLRDMKGKEGKEQIQGRWLVEVSELDAMRRSDKETAKAFISTRIDVFRPSYGRYANEFPRQCVFIGTTNSEQYLRDETGNRRFWPIKCSAIDTDGLRLARNQLWAEAVTAYQAGEKWHMVDQGLKKMARTEQDKRYEEDAWESAISDWLKTRSGSSVTQLQVMEQCLDLQRHQQHRGTGGRVSDIMKRCGWVRQDARIKQTDADGDERKTYSWQHPITAYANRK